MSFSDLPDEILAIIFKKLGDEDCLFLGPIIRTNTRGRNICLSEAILHTANVSPLCCTPSKIYTADAVGRLFFSRCLEFDNVKAIYFEALRLVTREQDILPALYLLEQIAYIHGPAAIAFAMFQMCVGRGDKAGVVFDYIFENFAAPLTHEVFSPQLYDLCEELITNLKTFEPPEENTFGAIWEFASSESVQYVKCDDWHGDEFCCEGCYIFNCAVRVTELL